MTTINNHNSLAEAVQAERQRLMDDLARLDKMAAILSPSPDRVTEDDLLKGIDMTPEPGRAPMAPRRQPKTMRDWIARTAKRQGTVTPDAVIAAAAEKGRTLNRKSLAVELCAMKRQGLLRKVPKGYAAQA